MEGDDAFPTAPGVAPWADLGLREEVAVFESASQNARVLTEGWVAASLLCPNCGAQPITRFAANRPVADFTLRRVPLGGPSSRAGRRASARA